MPFHPIALHFHVAVFIVNFVALIACGILRFFTTPKLAEEDKNTRLQDLFQTFDFIVIITLVIGLITTIIGIATGYFELFVEAEYPYDMFMQIKILATFIFTAFYALPLVYRLYYRQHMWKSGGMSLTFTALIVIGFFFLWVTNFVGSHYTSTLHHNPVEEAAWVLNALSLIGLFVMFGAQGSIVAVYTVGVEIEVSLIAVLNTLIIILDTALISYVLFAGFRMIQVNNYQSLLKTLKKRKDIQEKHTAEKAKQSITEFNRVLKEMTALKIKARL